MAALGVSEASVRRIGILAMAAVAAIVIGTSPAPARYYYRGWHGGWYGGWHSGVYFGFGGPWWWGYPYGYPYRYGYAYPYGYPYYPYTYPYPYTYSYPYPYPYTYAAPPGPTAPPQRNVWYYCRSKKAYYPYVSSCPETWQTVPAQPPKK